MSTVAVGYRRKAALAGFLVFWGVGASATIAAHRLLEARSPAGCLVISIAALVVTAFGYMRLAAPNTTTNEALLIGVAWCVLAIIAEVIEVSSTTPPAYLVLGSPAHETFRDILVIAWATAPSLFARRAV